MLCKCTRSLELVLIRPGIAACSCTFGCYLKIIQVGHKYVLDVHCSVVQRAGHFWYRTHARRAILVNLSVSSRAVISLCIVSALAFLVKWRVHAKIILSSIFFVFVPYESLGQLSLEADCQSHSPNSSP